MVLCKLSIKKKHKIQNTALLILGIAAFAVTGFGQSLIPPQPRWTPEVPEKLVAPQVDLDEFDAALSAALQEHPQLDIDELRRVRSAREVDPLGLLAEAPQSLEIVCMATVGTRSELAQKQMRARADLEKRIGHAARQGLSKIPYQYVVTFRDAAFPYAAKAPGSGEWKRINARGETLDYRAHTIVVEAKGELVSVWNRALSGFSARLTKESAAALAALPDVASVVPDRLVRVSTEQPINDQRLYGLDRIDEHNISTENLYRYHSTGGPLFNPLDTGSHVYVIDSGLRVTHEEFNSGGTSVGNGAFFATNSLNDVQGHGTHVAGTIGGATYGVAKNVTIHPVKVLDDYGVGSWTWVIDGVNWVIGEHLANQGQRSVANMSLGGSGFDPADTAVENLVAAGVVVVVAAGNNGADASHNSPARVSTAITVGATAVDDSKAHYSNWGPAVDIWAPGGDSGTRVLSAGVASDFAYDEKMGTSMAAPHVAGVAARYLQENPHLTPSEMMDVIRNVAVENKITGNLHGSDNLLLHYDTWWYPLHSNAEWMNSDVPYSTDHWFYSWVFDSWMWTNYELRDSNSSGDLAVYHAEDEKWLFYLNPDNLPSGYQNKWVFYDSEQSQFKVVYHWDMHPPTGPMIVVFPWL